MSLRRLLRGSSPDGGPDSPLRFRQHALPLGLVLLVFVVAKLDKVWSLSIDLSHHFALAYRIAEQWRLPVADPSLSEMNHYPWLAHVLAAIVGTALDSVYGGVQLVALLSLAGLWLAILGIVCTQPRQQAAWTCIALATLVSYDVLKNALDLHGNEIFRNFFFSQLAGHALMFAALWSAILVERRLGWFTAAATMLAWVQVIAFVHLLPALLLAGTAVLAILVAMAVQAWRGATSPRTLAWCAGLIALGGATVLLHPSFKEVAKIAQNDGELTLSLVTYPDGFRWLCLWVGLVSFAQIWVGAIWRPQQAAVRLVGLYGATVAALCVAQMLALAAGHGSPYAVKKYGFALNTHLVLSFAMAQGWVMARMMRGLQARLPLGQGGATALLCAMFGAILFTVAPAGQMLHAADIVRAERRVAAVRDAALPPPPAGKADIVRDLQGLPAQVAYMLSIGVLHTPREQAAEDILEANSLRHPERYARVLTSTRPHPLASSQCAGTVHGTLTALPPECLTVPTAPCRAGMDFLRPGGLSGVVLQGFSDEVPGAGGRWTVQPDASLNCVLDDPAAVREVVLTAAPYLGGSLSAQRLRVKVGTDAPREFNVTRLASFVVPLGNQAPGPLQLSLEMPDAPVPMGASGSDRRRLGVRLRAVEFR